LSITSGSIEKTVVLQDTGNITKSLLEFYAKINNRYDCYGLASELTPLEPNIVNGTLLNLKNQDVRLRQITDITKHNISSCKQVMKIAQLRHMDGVKGRIELSDTELIVTATLEKEMLHVIYSNVKQLVEQQQSIFEILWKKAIPAEKKIREIENGIEPPETKVLEDPDEIFNHMKCVIENASKILLCSSSGAMQM